MKHLYIVEIEWRNDDDEPWFVAGELVNMITRDPKHLIETAEKYPLRHNERIIVRQIADDVDWRTVEVVEPEMYENIYVREA